MVELNLCRIAEVSGKDAVMAISFSIWKNESQMEKSGRVAKVLVQFLTVIFLSSMGLPLVAHTSIKVLKSSEIPLRPMALRSSARPVETTLGSPYESRPAYLTCSGLLPPKRFPAMMKVEWREEWIWKWDVLDVDYQRESSPSS